MTIDAEDHEYWVLWYGGDGRERPGVCHDHRGPIIRSSEHAAREERKNWIDEDMPVDAARYVVKRARIVIIEQ